MPVDNDDLSPLDALKADFRAKLDADLPYVERAVNGRLTRYYYRSLNMATLGKIRRVSERDTAEGVMMSFIMRARDIGGNLLFKPASLTEMMRHVDADLVADLVAEMSQAEEVDDSALDGDDNPKPRPSSALQSVETG